MKKQKKSLEKKKRITKFSIQKYGGCSSVGRAEGCGSSSRGFDPRHSPHFCFRDNSSVGRATDS